MIELEGLSKSFGKVQALRDVSFTARDGRITGLLGPNGAGKSTTLRILSTLIAPNSGHGRIDGRDIATEPLAARRLLGVLPQVSGLYPNLTARENIRYFGQLHGLESAAMERRIDELIGLLELQEFAERRTKGFSNGQKLKVAIARAMVHSPRNLVLDEPTNGLDVMATRALRSLLSKLREAGHCILFSSHVMQEVSSLCDDIVIIAHGTVVARGTPEEIRQRTGAASLEDAFVQAIVEATGSVEGLQ